MKAKCSICGKWITLVHKTKTAPQGSRLRQHQFGFRKCWGSPTKFLKPAD